MRLLTAGSLVRVQLGEPNFAPLAQLVEQLTLNQWVLGSSPRWCTKECLTRKCRAFFCCSILRRHDLVHRRRYSNRAAARSAVRNATVRRSLARGRVPGNVAGVERRGDGERQGLEIKKCKFARVFMATISLDRKSTRLNSSHPTTSRMPSSA